MNKISTEHLLDLIDSLPKNQGYEYVIPGKNKAVLLQVNRLSQTVDVEKLFENGDRKSAGITSDSLSIIVNAAIEGKPFSVDSIFNGSGSSRSTWEALIANTTEFYWCKVNNKKHLVWLPEKPHDLGVISEIDSSNLPDVTIRYIEPSVSRYITQFDSELLNEDDLVRLLKEAIKLAPEDALTLAIHDFAIRYATHIANCSQLAIKTWGNNANSAILSDGKKIGLYYRGFIYKSADKSKRLQVLNLPLQQIYYGAPGTGKSNTIEERTNDTNRIRTTFHPDSDYSTFVGAYKPTMEETGELHPNGDKKSIITYSFVPQAFLKAYVNAWMIQEKEEKPHPYYLVIEEINRGNCAQIFGDLFQLLDRGPNGDSKYDITPDDDIRRHLADQFKNCSNLPTEIKTGEKMRLPNNLYIWATMNTSDQSLFPIDSAFKRRWDWEYVPIEDGKKGFYIDIDGKKYDWWNFIETINKKIDSITGSEDKKLGYWFAKPAGDSIVITQKQFISKVLFYLWNDVYKDYSDSTQSIFRRKVNNKDEKLPFSSFFGANAVDNILAFLDYNGINPYGEEDIADDPNDLASTNAVQKDFTRYSLNGLGNYSKGMVVFESIKAYVANNPQATAQEIRDYWVSLLPEIPHLVETNSEHTSRKSLSTDSRFDEKSKMLNLDNGETIFISNQFNVERIGKFVQKVNSENNNIQIETILG